jgi:hypothetical protein
MILYRLIVYLGYIISIIISLLFICKFNKLEKPLKVFSVFLILLSAVNIAGGILGYFKIPNVFLWHLFNYVEWYFMVYFYAQFYTDKNLFRIKISAVIVLLSLLFGSLFINKLSEFNIFGFFMLKMFVIILGIIEIYKSQLVSTSHYYYLNIGTVFISIVSVCFFTFWNLRTSEIFDFSSALTLAIVNATGFIIGLMFYFIEFYKINVWKENH